MLRKGQEKQKRILKRVGYFLKELRPIRFFKFLNCVPDS